uniref:DUF4005 domain-containing protein n=1 Tax=Anisakis simplex TaxID=6269 RepID=A0A0M3JFD6_ANISI
LKVGRISKPPEPSMSYSSPSSTIRADVIGSEAARSSEKFISSTSNSKLPSRQSIFGEPQGDNTTKGQDTTKTSSRISWSDPANTIEKPLSESRTPEQQKEHSERPKTQGVDASKADAFDDEDDDGMVCDVKL